MPTMIAGLLDTPPIVDSTEEPNGTDFLSLPPEVREMIYTLLPEVAQINITQHYPHDFWVDRPNAKGVNQPAASQVCRLMRQECLDVFYGKTDFMLDLHSWPHIQFPATWNPLKIFEQWISGIGNENAGRLRSVTFMSHCFSVHLRWSKNAQHLTLKFLPALLDAVDAETKEGVNWGYTYELATSRAEQGLRSVMDRIISERAGTLLRVDNFKEVGRIVNKLPPFICRRHLVLFGAFPQSDRVEDWPAPWFHLMKCRFCSILYARLRAPEAGTAVCVSSSGLLLTCSHCVAESEGVLDLAKDQWLLFADGRVVKATCVGYDGRRDLALLQTVAAQSPRQLDPTTANVTEMSAFPATALAETPPRRNVSLFCIGHPGSEDFEVDTPGVATGYDVLHIGEGRYRGLAVGQDVHDNSDIGALKHDCWTYWGHSGAPLINDQGLLVGLHSSWDDSTGMRRGVGWEAVKAFMDEYAAKIAS
ncbi:hypothetical protein LTR75_002579 [Friedmanniomyces endolithicus]|nr:hypothetical protein LTR75_002579 [Friedmanniomyces endolithicus]